MYVFINGTCGPYFSALTWLWLGVTPAKRHICCHRGFFKSYKFSCYNSPICFNFMLVIFKGIRHIGCYKKFMSTILLKCCFFLFDCFFFLQNATLETATNGQTPLSTTTNTVQLKCNYCRGAFNLKPEILEWEVSPSSRKFHTDTTSFSTCSNAIPLWNLFCEVEHERIESTCVCL